MPPITLWFLQASRSIRTAWLLEELNLPYDVKFYDRENRIAPQAYKQACGNPLGKAPTIQDGDVTVYESGAITEYLCEHYDPSHRLLPLEKDRRIKVQQWIHAAEGTLLLHALAITYARWSAPPHCHSNGDLQAMETNMAGNVQRDLDWLEGELEKNEGRFLVGDQVTAADVMVMFSVEFILKNGLGTEGRRWAGIERWLGECEACEGYRRAVERTGYKL